MLLATRKLYSSIVPFWKVLDERIVVYGYRLRHFRLRRRTVFDVCWWNLELVRIDQSRKKRWWPLGKVWNSCIETRLVCLQSWEFRIRGLPVVVTEIWDSLIISQICKTGGKHNDQIAWVMVSQLIWINIKKKKNRKDFTPFFPSFA